MIPLLLGAACAPAFGGLVGKSAGGSEPAAVRSPARVGGDASGVYDPRSFNPDLSWRADLSGNGVVDFADVQLFLEAWNNPPEGDLGQADIDMDGRITFTDLNILLALFGSIVTAPDAPGGPLQPGTGFTGPITQPAAVGVPGSPGYDAKAIARWDVVPYQEFTGEFNVGVVAFHRKGIDRVEFSLEGGPWLPVTEMTLNPRTQVWEYWATLNASDLPDGPVEVRAVAIPNVGEPRALEPLMLNANAHGAWGRGEVWVSALAGNDTTGNGTRDAPYKTIWKSMQSFGAGANIDGLTVYLLPGEYPFTGMTSPYPVTERGWVTLSSAPGVDAAQVKIVGNAANAGENRLRVGRIHLRGVTLDQQNGWAISSFNTISPMLWLDRVAAKGKGQFTNTKPFHYANWQATYATNSTIEAYKDGPLGATIARGVDVLSIGSDAFTNAKLVIDCTVRDMPGSVELGWHPDVYQFHGVPGEARENIIVYGLRAYEVFGQGIFAKDLASLKDIAFVNVLIDRLVTPEYGPNDPTFSQWIVEPTDHLLLWHVTLVNQEFRWVKDNVRNLSVTGSCFEALRGVGEMFNASGSNSMFEAMGDWKSNHFMLGSGYGVATPGVDISVGSPMFVNAAAEDFRPSVDSPLRARLQAICRPSADGAERQQVTSVGAFER